MASQEALFASMGVSLDAKKEMQLHDKWLCYSLNHQNPSRDIPIILIVRGPKNIAEIKKQIKNIRTCIIFFEEKNVLFFKLLDESYITTLENNSEYQRIASILKSTDMASAQDEFDLGLAIKKLIDKIPNATGDFVNKGLFSTHYLRNRIFTDTRQNIDSKLEDIKEKIGDTEQLLQALGWDIANSTGAYYDNTVSITITEQDDFSIRENKNDVAPSYDAIATLRKSQWAILTNGKRWRLYSAKISASSTNYFEISLDPAQDNITKYLIILFDALSFEKIDEKTDVDVFFEEGKNYAKNLEENLSEKIMSADGLFLDIVKGVLEHDMKKTFTSDELVSAKQTSLKIMYRIWFLAYAESRNLLPIRDGKYKPISLQSIRNHLDAFEQEPDEDKCWNALLVLFDGIRNGDKEHNLPQYNGDLFRRDPAIDDVSIKNAFIVKALYGLLENDGEAIDYADFSVRHLGNIFETLMEFSPRQTDKDIMLLEDSKGVREIKTKKDATYSYKKNDLYLASKGGIASRKTSASFYTPDEIVKFLVNQGLTPIFEEREKLVADDIQRYKKTKSAEDLQTCMNRILDIQVLDPSMGSGHFLVEVLNKITLWATDILKQHTEHPLISEIEDERKIILNEQKTNGITIDENLLTLDVILKRKIMKRSIFGVDLNPMAVDLAKLSLWLDSFAIGVPLTYMDHHLKQGDSTIGSFLDELKDRKNTTLDDWSPTAQSNQMICDVITNSDVTVKQVHASEDLYLEHKKSLEPLKRILDALTASKIDSKILPKKGKLEFIHKFGHYSQTEDKEFADARSKVNELAKRHHFFHWEIEMMDAFTDSRSGFDLIVGNPPWDKVKPDDDEFFTQFDPTFKSLRPNTKKQQRKNELLKSLKILKKYEAYKERYKEKNTFYAVYDLQGTGDKDLWKLVLELTIKIISKNGIISIVIPSQTLSNPGARELRKNILQKNIMSLYVFENKKKIFPIHSAYRFALLSVKNSPGPDEFSAGFYLHYLESLIDQSKEQEKFATLSKRKIAELSPDEHIISEVVGNKLDVLEKMSKNSFLEDGIGKGWTMNLSRGFDKTNDAALLSEKNTGWIVHEGKTIHQYNHKWSHPEFTSDRIMGLRRVSRTRAFAGRHVDFHNSYRLVFRNTTGPTNMRTVISSIIPPHTFHTHSLRSIILEYDNKITINLESNKKISCLCGLFNSLSFDFVSRSKVQMDLSTIIKSLPMPELHHENEITKLAAKMVVGTPEFEGFAESMRIPNVKQTPAQRIETAAEIDALVAHSYGLTINEYKTVTESFPAFKKNPALYDLDDITWDNDNLKEFYGEMAELALQYYEVIMEEQK